MLKAGLDFVLIRTDKATEHYILFKLHLPARPLTAPQQEVQAAWHPTVAMCITWDDEENCYMAHCHTQAAVLHLRALLWQIASPAWDMLRADL